MVARPRVCPGRKWAEASSGVGAGEAAKTSRDARPAITARATVVKTIARK